MSLTWQRSAEQALAIGAFASLPLAVPAPLGLAPLMILLAAVAGIGAIADRRAAMNA